MPNSRPSDHRIGSKSRVEIEGVAAGAFAAVSGLESTTEVIRYADGNDIVGRKRPGRTHYGNIVLKRGFVNNNELWNWYRSVTQGKVDRRSMSIILSADDGSEIVRYNCFEAWPCRWKSFALDASRTEVLVEELEIAVEMIERAD